VAPAPGSPSPMNMNRQSESSKERVEASKDLDRQAKENRYLQEEGVVIDNMSDHYSV